MKHQDNFLKTMERKVNLARSVFNGASDENWSKPLSPKSPGFSVSEEQECCAYLLEMEEGLWAITTIDSMR